MDLVLCHITADFDTLGAAVGVTRLRSGSKIILTGGCTPSVQGFLALYRDEYALLEHRAVNVEEIGSLTIVDTQHSDRLGNTYPWIEKVHAAQQPIWVYDHHLGDDNSDIPASHRTIEAVGATTTLIVEALQGQALSLTPAEATVMALGIHADTGSLTFAQTTARDAQALAWLMTQGADIPTISEFLEPGLSPQLQALLPMALARLSTEYRYGTQCSWLLLTLERYVPGLSTLTTHLASLSDSQVILLGAYYPINQTQSNQTQSKLMLIARSQRSLANPLSQVNCHELLSPLGGGGHQSAAAVTLKTENPTAIFEQISQRIRQQIPAPPQAREIMSAPVRTIRPGTKISDAQRILLRYGHSGLSVVNAHDQLVGIISRRDIDLALHHGFGHAPVKGYMTTQVKTITPDTPLDDIEALMVAHDIGRLPVLASNQLVGIVTRTDVLRQLQQHRQPELTLQGQPLAHPASAQPQSAQCQSAQRQSAHPNGVNEAVNRLPSPRVRQPQHYLDRLAQALYPEVWSIVQDIAQAASQQGWHLYLVGGAVRDLLRAPPTQQIRLNDIDLVVDGFDQRLGTGAGGTLAALIQQRHDNVELQVHGKFQTATLIWHPASQVGALTIDIATARTEFYPYPAANPEVEASSIQQDLYRRDFTINAMALRLSDPKSGALLDFFGGQRDLAAQEIRVLHANSFIEDPTRIYRGVRFAVRLGFTWESQTEGFIRYAIDSGIYTKMQAEVAEVPALQIRLRRELEYILAAGYWQDALRLLAQLGALRCIHESLTISDRLWIQLRRLTRWIERFQLNQGLEPWQMRLTLLLCQLPQATREQVARTLQLPTSTMVRLTTLETVEATLMATLPHRDRPSQIVQQLRGLDLGVLLLASVRHPRTLGRNIWPYLTTWRQMQSPLNGHDLRALGYQPSAQFKVILDAVLAATLDGQVRDKAQAIDFLTSHYPPN